MTTQYYIVQAFQGSWEACSLKYPSILEAMDYLDKLQPTISSIKLRIVKITTTMDIMPFKAV